MVYCGERYLATNLLAIDWVDHKPRPIRNMTMNIVPQNRQGYVNGKKVQVLCCACRTNEAIYRDPHNRPFCIACYKEDEK